jgi:hypothetical protein
MTRDRLRVTVKVDPTRRYDKTFDSYYMITNQIAPGDRTNDTFGDSDVCDLIGSSLRVHNAPATEHKFMLFGRITAHHAGVSPSAISGAARIDDRKREYKGGRTFRPIPDSSSRTNSDTVES